MSGKSYDFAVVGGGLVGAAIARSFALEKLKVIVLDEGDRAFRAARGNFALVWLQSKGLGMPRYANWTRESVSHWPEFAKEIEAESGLDLALRQRGGFDLALSDEELEQLSSKLRAINAQPGVKTYPYEILGGDEIRSRLPGAGHEIVGGSYCPLDGDVNALRLLRGLHKAMLRRGVAYRADHRVEHIAFSDGFRLSSAGRAPIEARKLVLAAGLDNARLAPMVGLMAPVRPQRGQIIVTERTAPFLDFPTGAVRQTDEGSILIGSSQEEAGLSDRVGS
ncbi:MAG: NAD(P)/FAD-dependent oxidoreductase, partial [Reyranellales bacterium]